MKPLVGVIVIGAILIVSLRNQPKGSSDPSDEVTPASAPGPDYSGDGPPGGRPEDFFPMAVGTTWTYHISLGGKEPTKYYETTWPQGSSALLTATRGRFEGLIFNKNKSSGFSLKLRVKGSSSAENPVKWPGVELEVLADDLKVFESTQGVFFSKTADSTYFLICTYASDTPGAPPGGWNSWNQRGYSMQLMFFAAAPMHQMSLGDNPTDSLTFLGADAINGYGRTLHFLRSVKPSKPDNFADSDSSPQSDALADGFTEESWFAREKGLVQLKQTRQDQTTMTWQLTDFSN